MTLKKQADSIGNFIFFSIIILVSVFFKTGMHETIQFNTYDITLFIGIIGIISSLLKLGTNIIYIFLIMPFFNLLLFIAMNENIHNAIKAGSILFIAFLVYCCIGAMMQDILIENYYKIIFGKTYNYETLTNLESKKDFIQKFKKNNMDNLKPVLFTDEEIDKMKNSKDYRTVKLREIKKDIKKTKNDMLIEAIPINNNLIDLTPEKISIFLKTLISIITLLIGIINIFK